MSSAVRRTVWNYEVDRTYQNRNNQRKTIDFKSSQCNKYPELDNAALADRLPSDHADGSVILPGWPHWKRSSQWMSTTKYFFIFVKLKIGMTCAQVQNVVRTSFHFWLGDRKRDHVVEYQQLDDANPATAYEFQNGHRFPSTLKRMNDPAKRTAEFNHAWAKCHEKSHSFHMQCCTHVQSSADLSASSLTTCYMQQVI